MHFPPNDVSEILYGWIYYCVCVCVIHLYVDTHIGRSHTLAAMHRATVLVTCWKSRLVRTAWFSTLHTWHSSQFSSEHLSLEQSSVCLNFGKNTSWVSLCISSAPNQDSPTPCWNIVSTVTLPVDTDIIKQATFGVFQPN